MKSDSCYTETEKDVYLFYVDMLFYVNCPVHMQTVSCLEKVLDDLAQLSARDFAWDCMLDDKLLKKAKSYVSSLLGANIQGGDTDKLNSDFAFDFSYRKLIPILKRNARSAAVKCYFDL